MSNTPHAPNSVVQYDKDEKEMYIRVWPHTVIVSPSRNDGYFQLTAISTTGTYTIEVSMRGGMDGQSIWHGFNSFDEVRVGEGRKEGETTVHAPDYVSRDKDEQRLKETKATVVVNIQPSTKVYYATQR